MSTIPSLYSDLDISKSEIRLLEVISDAPDGRGRPSVECRLSTVSLDDNPRFCALSYVWGDSSVTKDIIVNGCVMQVTSNLEAALRHVRHHWAAVEPRSNGPPFRLWADAICINQVDVGERAQQVRLMRAIYESAEIVLAWLCEVDLKLAFDVIRTIASEIRSCEKSGADDFWALEWLHRYPSLTEVVPNPEGKPAINPAWQAVVDFLGLPYWRRVWIFQEIVLARDLQLCAGLSSVRWEDMEIVSDQMGNWHNHFQESRTRRPQGISNEAWSWLCFQLDLVWPSKDPIAFRKMLRMEREILSMVGATERKSIEARFRSLHWSRQLRISGGRRATDPKDYIYGFLALADLDITPDYSSTKSVADVIVEFVAGWLGDWERNPTRRIAGDFRLKFLESAGIGLYTYASRFPTWAPNLPERAESGISGISVISIRRGKALADREVFESETKYTPLIREASLSALGIQVESIASIDNIGALDIFGYVSGFVSRHPVYVSGIPALQALNRLHSWDLDPNVDMLTILSALAFLKVLVSSGQDGVLQNLKTLGLDLEVHSKPAERFEDWFRQNFFPDIDLRELGFEGTLMKSFFGDWDGLGRDALYSFTQNRPDQASRACVETTGGYLGVALKGSRAGDVVCVLRDCHMPVILRQVKNHFVFIGTAFFVGLMHGEAAEFLDSGKSTPEIFDIR